LEEKPSERPAPARSLPAVVKEAKEKVRGGDQPALFASLGPSAPAAEDAGLVDHAKGGPGVKIIESEPTTGEMGGAPASGTGGHGGLAAGPGGSGDGIIIKGLRAPAYPLVSRLRGEEGSVEVSLSVGPEGRLLAARVLRSSGFAALDRAALKAVKTSRFSTPSPARGRASFNKTVVFVFRLKDNRDN